MLSWLGSLFMGTSQPSDSTVTDNSSPGLCTKCKFQPQARDPATGQYKPFCSVCTAPKTASSPPTSPTFVGRQNTVTSTKATVGKTVTYNPSQRLCVQCKLQPRGWNPLTGVYNYICSDCGALKKMSSLPSPFVASKNTTTSVNANTGEQPTTAPKMCRHCKTKPRFTDGTIVYPHCGRTCRDLAKIKRSENVDTLVLTSPVKTTNPLPTTNPPQATTSGNVARLPSITASTKTRNGTGFANPRNSVISTNPTSTSNNRHSIAIASIPTSPVRSANPLTTRNPTQGTTPGNTTDPLGANPYPNTRRASGSANPRNSVSLSSGSGRAPLNWDALVPPNPVRTVNPLAITDPSQVFAPRNVVNLPNLTASTNVNHRLGSANPRNTASLSSGNGRAPVNRDALVPPIPVRTINPLATTNPPQATAFGNVVNPPNLTAAPTNANSRPGPANPRNLNVAMPINPATTNDNRSSVYRATPSHCQTPGCLSPVRVDQNGVASGYCGEKHEELGKTGCLLCRKAPMSGIVAFCQSCYHKVLYTAPMIVEVPEDHERYKSVKAQFQDAWLHNDRCPKVRAIYKLVNTRANLAKYERYLNRVEIKRNFAAEGEPRGNERRRWHGTTRKCNIGDRGVTKFCLDTSCSLCCIMRTSFDLSFFGKKTNFGRFGAGIYTSATSSKSNDYSRNDCTSGWKAMLLSKVVIGRGYGLKVNSTALTEPPAGYDSVVGEVGVKLNYDELVVYSNDAIRPSYLIMYDTPKYDTPK